MAALHAMALCLTLRPVAWPSLKDRSERRSLKQLWDVLREDGQVVVSAAEYPCRDAAAALSQDHGLPGDTLITFRHEGKEYDSFKPIRLADAAVAGIRARQERARLAALREGNVPAA